MKQYKRWAIEVTVGGVSFLCGKYYFDGEIDDIPCRTWRTKKQAEEVRRREIKKHQKKSRVIPVLVTFDYCPVAQSVARKRAVHG